ncbi:MAG: hypothetical protein WBW06_12235 [Xanthobacteraceae bacterium]
MVSKTRNNPDEISTGMDGSQFLAHLPHVSRNDIFGNRCDPAKPRALSMTSRRFPRPWTIEETDARFIVKDKKWAASASSGETRSGPLPAVADFRQMQGKFSRVL